VRLVIFGLDGSHRDSHQHEDFILIEREETLPAVDIVGRREQTYKNTISYAGTKTATPLRYIPQSIGYVTKELVLDQAATTINDVVKNISGINQYSFYNELQRRSEEVRSENNTKPAPAAKTEKTDNKAEKKPRSPTVKGANYRIQVGAFKDKTQAEQMRKKAALGDLPVEIIYGENKHYLVLIGPYASKDQAIGIQKKLEGQSMQTLLKTFNNAP